VEWLWLIISYFKFNPVSSFFNFSPLFIASSLSILIQSNVKYSCCVHIVLLFMCIIINDSIKMSTKESIDLYANIIIIIYNIQLNRMLVPCLVWIVCWIGVYRSPYWRRRQLISSVWVSQSSLTASCSELNDVHHASLTCIFMLWLFCLVWSGLKCD